jgi:AraC-like DNA-binding protein
MRTLLERVPILRSRDFACAQAFLAERNIDLALTGDGEDRAGFDVRYNGVYLPGIWLGYIEYGAAVTARVSPRRGDYWVHVPLRGGFESAMGGLVTECSARRGVIASPREIHVIRSRPGAARLSLSINGETLAVQLAALLGDAPGARLEFMPGIGLDHGYGANLAQALHAAAARLESEDWPRSPLAASEFEQAVMTELLLCHPSNYSRALGRRMHPIAPRDVARALEFMHEHLAQPIRLADLVRVSGVAGRTLLKHFEDFEGQSPMRYLRGLRMKRVREQLLSGRTQSVARSARRWGFAHLGRFSVEYRRRFGEPPSATLQRRAKFF